ncbi:MAG: hypothetical protein HY706_19175 [Candidatus Hydrogenedentes bacterium]|nr:hypothetical protein [Candidatus Hydrogenedentota bacterium]
MKSRNVLIVVVSLLLACVGAIAVWKTTPAPSDVPESAQIPPRPIQSAPAPRPEPVEPVVQPPPEPVVEIPAAPELKTEEASKPPDPPAPAAYLTAASLAGTQWEQDVIWMQFLPDGRWAMNGRVCAKWEVVGSRVRIYDDKGEEHFLDIVGYGLEFNGEKITKAK